MTPHSGDIARLYDRHPRALLRFFVRRTYDDEASVDLVGETYAVAFEQRHRFRGSSDEEATGWLSSTCALPIPTADCRRDRRRAGRGRRLVPVDAGPDRRHARRVRRLRPRDVQRGAGGARGLHGSFPTGTTVVEAALRGGRTHREEFAAAP